MTARFDGKVLIPEGTFDAAPGTLVRFWKATESLSRTPGEIQALLDSTAGAWAEFDFAEPEELPLREVESFD